MTASLPDITLEEAIVAIDVARSDVCVLRVPDEARVRDAYPHVFGACDPFWAECGREAQQGELLLQIWHMVALLGMDPVRLHQALVVIPQYRELMPVEALPRPYR